MHKDIVMVSSDVVIKPSGNIHVVYFSSRSNNTHRFIEKLAIDNSRIPMEVENKLRMDRDYVLITPTYAAGGNKIEGAVPKPVINFLNNEVNRNYCKGVIASGNTNFGDTFAIAGPIISKKLNVPLLYQFELLGTAGDVEQVKQILKEFWEK
ncbi:class Ib ribonucleoside-diphosphate reductase assembly flavoprotein NrdI [Spiroplasma culicicola]|uniref:Protein NrdI n=1 Tax=Spiroplasma culicicola AES-1 TaxID=1276246 RepID=W6A8L1_9MOLU|nr:class Ib ribonucleoside-diphosphate reductase assembly flavoprotein NrdI [Spiroplasma culicicola]AHI53357.1 ribonucleotide reductase [Spiroplasma culicicola AES-1]